MFTSKKVGTALFTAALLLITALMYFFYQSPEKAYNEQGGTSYASYERAKVLRVISEDLAKDPTDGGLYHGTQQLEVKILSGEHKGEVHTITNYLSPYINVLTKKGQTVVVNVDSADHKHYYVTVYSHYRAPIMGSMILLFFGILWAIGGKKGLKSVAGILFTFASIFYLFIPMLYRGYSPIFATVVVGVLTTCITLLLLNGWSSKSLAAILGTTAGVVITGVFAYVCGELLQISGFNTKEVEVLLIVSQQTGMQLKGILFAGIMLASLGAIIDVGISIASSVYEVYQANPNLSKRELFLSGINVGRDMMGTMANTLLLAFTGTTLSSLMILYAMKVPFTQLTNMNMVTIEVIQGITGCFGVVLTVPIVAFISSRMMPRFEKVLINKNERDSEEVCTIENVGR
ncbi:YibE/F family protein [Bacillus xiapuensis]|uniref:YibE/F family protein n=1 Tax=Bacillus xiapuensis TaxID=2014075 RepID=A0ABU6N6F3_9BACI|nr:YibE/F family protein [Bacillus xiapuensis]